MPISLSPHQRVALSEAAGDLFAESSLIHKEVVALFSQARRAYLQWQGARASGDLRGAERQAARWPAKVEAFHAKYRHSEVLSAMAHELMAWATDGVVDRPGHSHPGKAASP